MQTPRRDSEWALLPVIWSYVLNMFFESLHLTEKAWLSFT